IALPRVGSFAAPNNCLADFSFLSATAGFSGGVAGGAVTTGAGASAGGAVTRGVGFSGRGFSTVGAPGAVGDVTSCGGAASGGAGSLGFGAAGVSTVVAGACACATLMCSTAARPPTTKAAVAPSRMAYR